MSRNETTSGADQEATGYADSPYDAPDAPISGAPQSAKSTVELSGEAGVVSVLRAQLRLWVVGARSGALWPLVGINMVYAGIAAAPLLLQQAELLVVRSQVFSLLSTMALPVWSLTALASLCLIRPFRRAYVYGPEAVGGWAVAVREAFDAIGHVLLFVLVMGVPVAFVLCVSWVLGGGLLPGVLVSMLLVLWMLPGLYLAVVGGFGPVKAMSEGSALFGRNWLRLVGTYFVSALATWGPFMGTVVVIGWLTTIVFDVGLVGLMTIRVVSGLTVSIVFIIEALLFIPSIFIRLELSERSRGVRPEVWSRIEFPVDALKHADPTDGA